MQLKNKKSLKSTESLTPVSYTHLESTLDNKYKGNVKQNETTTSIEAPVFVATDRTGAVSYPHLDVYKRQYFICIFLPL